MNREDQKHLDEAELLKRVRKFDQEALTWVYQTYHDAIYRYIFHHVGGAQVAEDLASDVFRRFLRALRKGGGPTRQLSAWLYRVAHNLIVDEIRRREHRDHESLDEALGDVLSDGADSLESLIGDTLAVERVREVLLELTEEQRQVIVLKFLEGMDNAEVAEIIGKSVGAVKALQHRGLDALRIQLVTPQEPMHAGLGWERAQVPSLG